MSGRRVLVGAVTTLLVLAGATAGAVSVTPARPRTAAELIADLTKTSVPGLSGTVVLRLPEGAGLLAGTHTLRVWFADPGFARIAVLARTGETDIITNGRDVWVWSSREQSATHSTLPAGTVLSPDALVRRLLAGLGPDTLAESRGGLVVAGRPAHELVLTPADGPVAEIRIAVDDRERAPLRVSVFTNDLGAPSLEAGFTQVSFARPDPGQFVFNPPPGTTVGESDLGLDSGLNLGLWP